MKTSFVLLFHLLLFICFSCNQPEEVIEEVYQPRSEHEAYTIGLQSTGLDQSRLGQLWLGQANEALDNPTPIETPYAAHIYVSDTEAKGFGYKFDGLLGQRITISVDEDTPASGHVFIDLFRANPEGELEHLATADSINHNIVFEPLANHTYLLRVQPELLKKGKYRLEIKSAPALAFPVAGRDKSAIGSLFGVPRDAGRRKHHGIDIFARRHTPIIAPSDGYIKSTEPNLLGGNVIWMKDDNRNQVLYFAHLQDVVVEDGDYVTKGDTIGSVGNSGNAITTSPHLHFGIYSEGPVDPYNFVVTKRTRFKRELAKSSLIGQHIRTNKPSKLKLLDRDAGSLTLIEDQLLLVRGTTGIYYHVEIPDGTSGHISYVDIEELSRPLRKRLPEQSDILDEPTDASLIIVESTSLQKAKPLALHKDYTFISIGDEYRWVRS